MDNAVARLTVPVPIDAARALLKSVFGFDAFRPGQEEIVQALLGGEDVLAIMPTGSGKSLCYQLPALVMGGLTVVVSPLIALMRDQVRQLRAYGIAAASLNSSNDIEQNRQVHDQLMEGSLRLLYVSPERLARADTIAWLRDAGVRLLAIDEAHCVSQWGHDFRPEYMALGRVRAELGGVRTIALTATADAPTRADIVEKLFTTPPRIFVRSFDRPNLRLAMAPKANTTRQVLDFVRAHQGMSGIVYCLSRKRTEEYAAMLSGAGYRALAYHAGLEKPEREASQDAFLQEDGIIIVATIAFGMGIDKPDVRFVCHADLPQNVESYYQEIGRAGRDGLPADTLTLYGLDEMRLRREWIEQAEVSEERKRIDRQRLNALIALCEAPRCRRQTLLAYFGEPSAPCGNCDLCINGVEAFDGTIDAQKAMSAIVRTGERFGTEHLVNILIGEATEAVLRYRHEALPTFGVGSDRKATEWRSIFRQIYAAGLIALDIVQHGRWTITDAGWRVLRGHEKIELRRDVLVPGKGRRGKVKASTAASADGQPVDQALLDALKALRTSLARQQQVPAYVIFPDRTLIDMAARRPTSLAQMLEVDGIGQVKLERYGTAFLEVVQRRAASGQAEPSS
ncbi:DNA helicase RecQ [Vineibacter terrae]|uniref:DNA helicase RecQ n=1 Tax=Vineibacter terrae TaxID=2586908 RepID=UPI002E34C576|nr:DNA helicase RecQ [Vineibacter terrae]HEX2887712.1 DNA helicase RecQ [Vineibacter terrae]